METNDKGDLRSTWLMCHDVLTALRRIIQAMDLHSRDLLRRYGITGPQLILLYEISAFGEITVSALARATSLSQGTVTNILVRLEKRNLVTRHRSETDRRRVYVKTTPACDELLASAPSPMQETFVRRFSKLEPWERHMILGAVQRLAGIMGEGGMKDSAPEQEDPKDNGTIGDGSEESA